MDENQVIALAVKHKLGRTMKPLGMQTGDVFVTDQSYRTGELMAFSEALVAAERERCAAICDVTPPYPFRASIEAAHAIRALGPNVANNRIAPGKK